MNKSTQTNLTIIENRTKSHGKWLGLTSAQGGDQSIVFTSSPFVGIVWFKTINSGLEYVSEIERDV